MRTFIVNLQRVIRYARPDHNPLRRPIDRLHARVITLLGALLLLIAPIAATAVAHAVARAGLRAEHQQALTRHRADATVVGVSSTAPEAAFAGTTRIAWHDASGAARIGAVPAGGEDRPGAHRTIWIDATGHLTTHPRKHSQTIADTVMAALTMVILVTLLHSIACTAVDRRLDRKRLALWEEEWISVSPRWTGRR